MPKRQAAPLRFIPAALWYGVVFWFSSRTASASGGQSDGLVSRILEAVSPAYRAAGEEAGRFAVEVLSFPVRKGAHMFLYFVLALLLLYALPFLKRRSIRGWTALAACAVLAALDEYHQTFVPGRSGEARDVAVDLCGSAIALGLWAYTLWAGSPKGGRRALWTAVVPIGALTAAYTARHWTGPVSALVAKKYVDNFTLLNTETQARLITAAGPIIRDALVMGAWCFLVLWGVLHAWGLRRLTFLERKVSKRTF